MRMSVEISKMLNIVLVIVGYAIVIFRIDACYFEHCNAIKLMFNHNRLLLVKDFYKILSELFLYVNSISMLNCFSVPDNCSFLRSDILLFVVLTPCTLFLNL